MPFFNSRVSSPYLSLVGGPLCKGWCLERAPQTPHGSDPGTGLTLERMNGAMFPSLSFATRFMWIIAEFNLEKKLRKQLLCILGVFVSEFSPSWDDIGQKSAERYTNISKLQVVTCCVCVCVCVSVLKVWVLRCCRGWMILEMMWNAQLL